MAQITAKAVNDLRIKMGVGLMDCKRALVEADGDEEKAIKILREKGLATAAKKQSRIAAEGIVESYIHMGGKIGVMVKAEAEAATEGVLTAAKDCALQVAAMNPPYLKREDVPAEVLENEKKIMLAQMDNDPKMANKPEQVREKIVVGKLNKFYAENCLLQQDFVKDGEFTVEKYIEATAKKLGGKVTFVDAVRFEKGEGIEKKEDNFAAEVASMIK